MSDITSEGYIKLSSQIEKISDKLDITNEKLELYKTSGDERIDSIRKEVEAFQDANKQQLNVSLGVLVTSAIAILVSAVISR